MALLWLLVGLYFANGYVISNDNILITIFLNIIFKTITFTNAELQHFGK